MSNVLEKLGKLIRDKEGQLRERRLQGARIENRWDNMGRGQNRYKGYKDYVDRETGEENFDANTEQLEKEIKELRDEYDVEEAIEEDKKKRLEKDFKDREEAERERGAEPIERTSVEKVDTRIPGYAPVDLPEEVAQTKAPAGSQVPSKIKEAKNKKPRQLELDLQRTAQAAKLMEEAAKARRAMKAGKTGMSALRMLGSGVTKGLALPIELLSIISGPSMRAIQEKYENKDKPKGT